MKRILVVDDEPSTGELAAEYLRLSGFEAILCPDAESALALLRAGNRFDLAVVDKRMPGMSGIDLCQALKLDPATKDMPVIMLSASVNPATVDTGVNASLAKPFSPKELASAVRKVLS